MEYKGLTLDKFQEDAVQSIENNNSVVVSAPTGSGKTLIADYIINKHIQKGDKVIYTAPIKALSNQKYKEFSTEYGEENVGLLTGDIVKNPNAKVLIMTTEIYRNMALTNDPDLEGISYVIFDEIHFINDIERGYVWEESIIFSRPKVRFLCLSATIPNADQFADWIRSIKRHKVDVIKHDKRNVPLHKYFYDSELGITNLEDIQHMENLPDYQIRGRKIRQKITPPNHVNLIKEIVGNLPCFFFNFSRKSCQDNAEELARADIFVQNPEITSFVRRKLERAPVEINSLKSTRILRNVLPYGIAFHHAGLLPIMKEIVEELFSKGLIKVLYTTETFAVGINMPAKTVCFQSLRKYDGITFRFLNSKEYFQIAGRAGRRGIDTEGFVYAMLDRRDFDYNLFKKITSRDTEPIKSQFRLSVNTVLNLIKQHNRKEIDQILIKSFNSFQKYGSNANKLKKDVIYHTFNNIKRKLERLNYISNDQLTEKGEFSSMIYADEITIGELFATGFYRNLNEYQLLLLIASLCYEPRERTEFYNVYPSKMLNDLRKQLKENYYLQLQRKFNELKKLTAFVHPCYTGKDIFEIIKNTNLLEGDNIRFFRQMLDRIGQIKKATHDPMLKGMLESCQLLINNSLKDIDAV